MTDPATAPTAQTAIPKPTPSVLRTLHCCGCAADVPARLTSGREVYPHRPDLARLPFWRCDTCGNHVGCHHKTRDRTRPLGAIPTAALRTARRHIHAALDPIWKSGRMSRDELYARLSATLGHPYHTGDLRTLDEVTLIRQAVRRIIRDTTPCACGPAKP